MEDDGWPELLEMEFAFLGLVFQLSADRRVTSRELLKTLDWSRVPMSLEYLSLPHFLSRPEGEKLEMQVLRGFQAKGNLL